MAQSILQQVELALETAEALYHRLVLLVGASGSGKTCVLQEIASKFGTKLINVNLEVSGSLLELTAKQRSIRLPVILDQALSNTSGLIILDNLEILFDKELQQDPLRLLQGISRNHTVVASWNGSIHSGKLIYAEVGHPEYRSYDPADALIITMNGSATIG